MGDLEVVDILLFDINKFEVEKTAVIDIEEILREEFNIPLKSVRYENKAFLVSAHNHVEISVIDKTEFIRKVLLILFPDYKVEDHQNNRRLAGLPDFMLYKDNCEPIYLELKMNSDGLSLSQLTWFSKNKDKINKVLWVVPKISYSKDLLSCSNVPEL